MILRTEAGKEEVVVPDGNTSLMFLSTGVKRLDIEKQTTLQTGKNAVVVGQKSRPVLYQFDPGPALETIECASGRRACLRLLKCPWSGCATR